MTRKTWVKAITFFSPQTAACLPLVLPTSPLPLSQASLSTQQPSGHPCHALPSLKPQCSTAKSLFTSQTKWWQSLTNSVHSVYPLEPSALLSKGTTPTVTNSSSSHKDWMELCERMRTTPSKTANNLKYSDSKEKLWQSARHMQLS